MIKKLSVTVINYSIARKNKRRTHRGLLVCCILFFICRYVMSGLHKGLMQYHTKVDVKIGCELILALTRRGRIGRYCVCHKSKTVFFNLANITREYVGNVTEFIRDLELTLPSIVEWDCKTYLR